MVAALDVARCGRLLMVLSIYQGALATLRDAAVVRALLALTLALMEADG